MLTPDIKRIIKSGVESSCVFVLENVLELCLKADIQGQQPKKHAPHYAPQKSPGILKVSFWLLVFVFYLL